jgi:hypothetical protein
MIKITGCVAGGEVEAAGLMGVRSSTFAHFDCFVYICRLHVMLA